MHAEVMVARLPIECRTHATLVGRYSWCTDTKGNKQNVTD